MPRKKKQQTIVESYTPSKYQRAILDFVEHGQGSAVIEAEAGSAKSTTLIWSLYYIPEDANILFTAFNTDIVDDLKKRIKKEGITRQVECKTMHSLGYAILMSNYPREIERQPNTFKYSAYIYNNIRELGGEYYSQLRKKDQPKYVENVKKLVDLGRCFLARTMKDMEYIERHYSIPVLSNEKEVAMDVMDWGMQNFQTIDFTDMIWLPNVLNCKPYGRIYDWILVDEAQDTSVAERELILRCTKMSTRILWSGQKIQTLYSFMASDASSFDEIKSLPNTISLPLSISYRCARKIVRLANRFSPTMQPAEDAPDGEVRYNVPIDEIEDGDMVLCRVNAPLLQMYCELANRGKTAYICGKDIGENLEKLVKKTKEEKLNQGLTAQGVFSRLYDSLFTNIDNVMRRNSISFEMALEDQAICEEYDIIQALEILSDGCEDAECLIEKIKGLFSDKKKKGIRLSTIHKAKGLEADNVFICCPSLMPSKSAKEDWEIQQEANLEYVAYTRAKKKLCFLTEDGFNMYSSNAQQKAGVLQAKKPLVMAIHGGMERCSAVRPTVEAAKEIIRNSTNVERQKGNTLDIGARNNTLQVSSFDSIMAFRNRQKKVRRPIKI